MKKIVFLLISLVSGINIYGQQKTVEMQIKTFFEGMAKHDTVIIKSTVHETCQLRSMSKDKAGNVKFSTVAMNQFYTSIASLPKDMVIEERISKIETNQDELMAYAWTPYQLFVNQKLSHSGTNLFTLSKINGDWMVVSIIDTRFR